MELEYCMMKYKIQDLEQGYYLKILGDHFIINNKNKAKLIINNRKSNLSEFIEIINLYEEEIKLKMVLNKNIYNKSYMFKDCKNLFELSIKNIPKYLNNNDIKDEVYATNTNLGTIQNYPENIEEFELFQNFEIDENKFYFFDDINEIFSEIKCMKEISKEPSTIREYLKKVEFPINYSNLRHTFYNCPLLKSLSDLSKWNINFVTDISGIFCNCRLLTSLPDISGWKTDNITDMSFIFYNCNSLSSLPDISKWNIDNVANMSCMFGECMSISSLPDISKWNTDNVKIMDRMFDGCCSILFNHQKNK
jgi:surface protein